MQRILPLCRRAEDWDDAKTFQVIPLGRLVGPHVTGDTEWSDDQHRLLNLTGELHPVDRSEN